MSETGVGIGYYKADSRPVGEIERKVGSDVEVEARPYKGNDRDHLALPASGTSRPGIDLGYQIIDVHDTQHGHSAMMRTTAFPAAIVAGMLATGEVERRGVVPGEECVPMAGFLKALAARDIVVEDC